MTNEDTELIGEAAVQEAGKQVHMTLGWIFRAQPVLDYGIDAQVEIKIDSAPTGRLLALQVKGGNSFFKKKKETKDGWIFRPEAKHVRYWLRHTLPVIVVLVDLRTDTAYWEHVNPQTISSTGKGFKLLIPKKQVLTQAKGPWLEISQDMGMRASERYRKNLDCLPPSAVENLEKAWDISPAATAWLALFLAEGRTNPELTVATLQAGEPSWLQEAGRYGWGAIAAFASEHDLSRAAAAAFERAANLDDRARGRLLAQAGLQLTIDDKSKAQDYFNQAITLPGGSLLARIGTILASHPSGDANPMSIPVDLELSTPEAEREPATHALLAIQAQRQQRHDECIVELLKAQSMMPNASTYMLSLADAYVKRAIQRGDGADDLQEAYSWATRHIEQRRRWDGNTIEALRCALGILVIQGDFEKVIQIGAPEPHGEARAPEARDPQIARTVTNAAKTLNRERVIDDILELIEDEKLKHRIRLELSDELTKNERIILNTEILEESIESDSHELWVSSVMALAALGEDRIDTLDYLIERGITSSRNRELASALHLASYDLDQALPKLRTLADTDIAAAQQLIVLLVDAERLAEAEAACERAYSHLREPDLQVMRFDILVRAERFDVAEVAGREALSESAVIGIQRARICRFLAMRSAEKRDWAGAERSFKAAVKAASDITDMWNLVQAQLSQRRDRQAANSIALYELIPRSISEARIWLRAMISLPWNDQIVGQALTLADRFKSDAQFSGSILLHIVSNTRSSEDSANTAKAGSSSDARSEVNSDLRRQAFAALGDYADLHGASGLVQKLDLSPEQMVDRLAQDLSKKDHTALHELIKSIQLGNMPLGMLSLMVGLPYALTVLQRAAGVQVAATFDIDLHEEEMNSAFEALQGVVVVDSTAFHLSGSIERGGELRGLFADLLFSASARDDVVLTAVRARGLTGSVGVLGWDSREQRMTLRETSDRERAQLWEKAEMLDEETRRTNIQGVEDLSLFQHFNDKTAAWPWLEPIELAHQRKISLWSDDVAQRKLARGAGVASFGTPALVEAVIAQRLETAAKPADIEGAVQEQQAFMRSLLAENVVDIPTDLEDLLDQGDAEGWAPASVAVQLTRPAWWAWRNDPLKDLLAIYARVRNSCPENLSSWQIAAMNGAAVTWSSNPSLASAVVASIALLGFDYSPDVESARLGLMRAGELAKSISIPAPEACASVAATMLNRFGYLDNPEAFVLEVLSTDDPGAEG